MNIYSNKRRPVKAGATLERENDMEIVLRDDDGAQLRVVYRPNVKGYVIRRTLNDGGNGRFEWDQSKEIYDTAEEAKQAALDGRVTFNFKGRKTPPLPVKSSTRRRSVKANHRKVIAANSSNVTVSKIKKFIKDSVNSLQNSDYTNCRLILDSDLCLYVGYSDGFDTEDGYSICAKIAERNDADWADFDYLNMPWNTYNDNNGSTGVFEGDVYDTEVEITPGEDYTQDAQWLADSYAEIRNLLDEGKLTIEASCGKKSVKSSTRRRSVKCNAGKLDDIAYVMQNYINGNGFVLEQDLGNGKYVVSYQGTPVTIEFDPSFSEYVYFINGEGPYSHNSYEYIYDDIREYVDSITDEWGNVIASANKAVKASDFEFIYDIPEDEEDADDMSGAYYYDELTPEQQQYVVDNWEKLLPTDTLYQWHSDDTMDWYHYDISELAKEYEKQYGLNIDVNKIYWQSNSQGPYPEWRLSDVINKTYISDVGNIRDIDIAFEGSLTVEGYASYWIDNGDGGHYDYEILPDELSDMGVDQMAIDAIEAEINAAQEFVDKAWELINDVCRSYPDDDWVQGMLEGNPQIFTFYVDEDGVVEDASL